MININAFNFPSFLWPGESIKREDFLLSSLPFSARNNFHFLEQIFLGSFLIQNFTFILLCTKENEKPTTARVASKNLRLFVVSFSLFSLKSPSPGLLGLCRFVPFGSKLGFLFFCFFFQPLADKAREKLGEGAGVVADKTKRLQSPAVLS